MPSPVGGTHCEVPDSSSLTREELINERIDELIETAPHDLVEKACKDAPFIPDSWCEGAADLVQHVVDEVKSAEAPSPAPEHAWNLDST